MSRANCCRACLRGSLRALNYVLAILGVLMMAYAAFMFQEWADMAPTGDTPPPPPPSPPPPPLDNFSGSPAAYSESSVPNTWLHAHSITTSSTHTASESKRRHARLPRHIQFWSAKESDAESPFKSRDTPGGFSKYPWIIYLFGGAGAFIFVTAAVGIISADCASCGITCFLGLYHTLMVLLLLLQVALVCFYFFDKSWEEELPPDQTGEYHKMRAFIIHNLKACKIAGLVTLSTQVLALVVSCSVYYAESAPRLDFAALDRYDDEVASRSSYHSAGGTSSALLARPPNRTSQSARTRGSGTAWDRRMQEKYGVSETRPSFDPEAARAAARGDEDVTTTNERRGCVIM